MAHIKKLLLLLTLLFGFGLTLNVSAGTDCGDGTICEGLPTCPDGFAPLLRRRMR